MLEKGDLVQIQYKPDGWHKEMRWIFATVLDYKPDQLGGSSIQSWYDDAGKQHSEVVKEPRRGIALVVCTDIDLCSWWDEGKLRRVPKP